MGDIIQRTDEWYQERLGKVTASRVADVMAQGKNGTPSATRKNYMAELIAERLTGKKLEGYNSAAMQWGVENESLARSAYEAEKLVIVEEVGFIAHPTIKHFGASPDGLVGLDGLVEIKCPNTSTHIDNLLLPEKIDNDYMRQMYGQGACTKRKWCDFVSFDPRLPDDKALSIHRIEFSQNVIDEIEEAVVKFLQELEIIIDRIFEKRPQGREEYIERWRK
jgi:putative phage-type endonuclease